MSQHPSLKSSEKMKAHRSVMKRYERVRTLNEKGEWEEKDSVYGLPKVKIVRFKIKKEKTKAEATTETPADGSAPTPAAGAPAASKAAGGETKKAEAKPKK